MNSINYFMKILNQKHKLLGERPDTNDNSLSLHEIDIF